MNNKIAIFGGSFNPIHLGHKMIVAWLKEVFNYNSVHIIPTFNHAFDKSLIDFNLRFEMCKLAMEDIPYTFVSKLEMEMPQPNRTVDIINWYLNNTQYKIDLILGSDILYDLDKWHNWKSIENSVNKIIVIERPGYTNKYIVDNNSKFDYYKVGLTTISSSEVRQNIKDNRSFVHLVGSKIENYILKNGLYK